MQTRRSGKVTIACEPWEKPEPKPEPTQYVKSQYQVLQERRQKIKALALSGKSKTQIRDIMKVSETIVQKDLTHMGIKLRDLRPPSRRKRRRAKSSESV